MSSPRIRWTEALKRFLPLFDALLQWLVPARQQRVCYFSTPDYEDNAYFVYRHLVRTRGGLEHVWLLQDPSVERRIRDDFDRWNLAAPGIRNHLIIARKRSLSGYWLYLRSRRVFYTHALYRGTRWVRGREIICLWHGMPIKCIGALDQRRPPGPLPFGTRHLASSHFFRYIVACAFRTPPQSVVISGLPRCDALRDDHPPDNTPASIRRRLDLPEASRLVLWMPTFRTGGLRPPITDQNYRTFLDDVAVDALQQLDASASAAGCQVIVKPHPGDPLNHVEVDFAYSSIRLLRSPQWLSMGIPLYELIAAADGLMSDVSSVLIDFLPSGRPIGLFAFDPDHYHRDLTFPLELLLKCRTVHNLTGTSSIENFFQLVQQGPARPLTESDLATAFHETFSTSGCEQIATEVGL